MKGIIIDFPSAEVRGDFKKSFLINAKRCKVHEKAFSFTDIPENYLGIEINDDIDGSISCALITIKGHNRIKISGIGMCRFDPIDLPDGASVLVQA